MPAMFSTSNKPNNRRQQGERQGNKPGLLKQMGRGLAKLGQGASGGQAQAAKPGRMQRDVQAGSLSGAQRQSERRSTSINLPGAGPVGNLGAGAGTGGKAVQAAKAFLGQPYDWAGGHGGTMSRPGPVDCSGLVQQVGRKLGVNLDGTAASQQKMGHSVSMANLKPGDLVFRGAPAHHVGIYAGGGQVIHAPKAGEQVSYVSASYFHSARRVLS